MKRPRAQRNDGSEKEFYVYAIYREDGQTPFYIGKGKGRRYLSHRASAKYGTLRKDYIIRRMLAEGKPYLSEILENRMTNVDAKRLEVDLVQLIGREPVGPLVNRTAGGDGGFVSAISREKNSRAKRQRWAQMTPEQREAAIAKLIAAGRNPSPETRAKMSQSHKGRIFSDTHIARLTEARKHRVITEETREKHRNLRHSPETRAKIGHAARNRTPEAKEKMRRAAQNRSPEHIEKIRQALLGRHPTPETIAKLKAKKWSEEQRIKIVAALLRRGSPSEATREKIRQGNLGKVMSAESIEKIRQAKRNISDETRAKMSESAKKRVERLGFVGIHTLKSRRS